MATLKYMLTHHNDRLNDGLSVLTRGSWNNLHDRPVDRILYPIGKTCVLTIEDAIADDWFIMTNPRRNFTTLDKVKSKQKFKFDNRIFVAGEVPHFIVSNHYQNTKFCFDTNNDLICFFHHPEQVEVELLP